MTECYLSSFWSRQVDQLAINEYGMSGLVLMENAGRGCADLLERLGIGGEVLICCGKGNNAGDGFVIARHLERRGNRVKVLLWSPPSSLQGDAAHNCHILERAGTPMSVFSETVSVESIRSSLQNADWIVDAILGTGSTGAPRPPFDAVITAMNLSLGKKLAIDLPSGLNCDTGEPAECTFRADHTATFVAPKLGFKAASAAAFVGQVHVIDIGAPQKLIQEIVRLSGESAKRPDQ